MSRFIFLSLFLAILTVSFLPAHVESAFAAIVTHKVYFDIAVDGDAIGRVVFGLYGELQPKAVFNFWHLCKGGGKSVNGHWLHYKGSKMHSVQPNMAIAGGDYIRGDGYGGESVFGGHFTTGRQAGGGGRQISHAEAGVLSMASISPNQIGSQFFITLTKATWLDTKHLVIGRVLDGMSVVRAMEQLGNETDGRPVAPIEIADSGALHGDDPYFRGRFEL